MFEQNATLAKKVDDMELKLEKLSDQNVRLLELLEGREGSSPRPPLNHRDTLSATPPVSEI